MTEQQAAEGHVCIFHPRIRAVRAYRVLDKVTKNFFDYGLCPLCDRKLKKLDSFIKDINAKLEELTYKLKKQEEKKCQTKQKP